MTPEARFEDYLSVLFQIYTCEIEKGKTLSRTKLTDEKDRCTDPRYLSDGTLIFTRDRDGDENFQIGLIENDGNLHWLTSDLGAKHRISRASNSFLYFVANLTDRARLDAYRWKIPLRDNKPELIYEPEQGLIVVAGVSSDENKVLMIQYLGNMDQHLLLLDIASGDMLDLTVTISGKQQVRWEVVRWLDPDNILVSTDYKADFKRLSIITTSGSFTPLDDLLENVQFEIEQYTHTKDSIWTYFVENQEGYSTIHRAKFSKDGATDFETLQFPLKAIIPEGDARSWNAGLSLSSDEHMLTVTVSSGVQPTNVWIVNINDMSNWRANEVSTSGLNPSSFVQPTFHRFDSFDELSVPYFRYIPQGVKPPDGWPALLVIHGGPESQVRPGFDSVFQAYLSSGFAIVTPNIRGSAGYGRTYLDLDNVEKRLDSIMDIKHLALHIKSEDDEIDGSRLVVYGGSYVLSAMTEHPELWKAGVDIVGISNFVTFLKNTAAWRRSLREAEYGSLERDLDTLEKISPIHKIDRISAPLFIIQGDNDERVPLSESIQMYEKVKEKGLPVKMLRFADEGHGLAKLENRIKAYSEVVAWLNDIG
jgi:dipeptidyl aminopeptidase/acylaminoacyl peptidase